MLKKSDLMYEIKEAKKVLDSNPDSVALLKLVVQMLMLILKMLLAIRTNQTLIMEANNVEKIVPTTQSDNNETEQKKQAK